MSLNPDDKEQSDAQLRAEAETRFAQANPQASADELLHKLQVRQIELEMQNETLRQSQITLEESRDRYANLYDLAPIGYLTLNSEEVITEINLTAAAMFGQERNRLLYHRFTSFVTHEDHERWHCLFIGVKQQVGNKPQHSELLLRRQDLMVFHARLDCLRVVADGKVTGVRVALTDINERKHAEILLQRIRQREQHYLDVANVMLLSLDSQGRVLTINRKGCEVLGQDERDIVGKIWFDNYLPERVRKGVREIFNQLMNGDLDPAEYVENVILTGYGEERMVAWHNTYLQDEEGKIIATISSGEDITERKRAEAAQWARSEFFHELFDQAPMPYQSLNEEGCFLDVNLAWEGILGYGRGEVLGRWFGDYLAPEFIEAFHQRFSQFKGGGRIHCELEMLHKNGSRRLIAFEGRIAYKPDGSFKQAHCVLSDITERREQEAKILQLQQEQQAILDHAQVGILFVKERRIVSYNRHFAELHGYGPDELIGKSSECVYDSHETFMAFGARAYAAISEKGAYCEELRVRRKDGSLFWGEVGGRALDPVRPQEGSVWICIDISMRKQAELQLLESEQRYRTLADSGTALIWTAGTDKLGEYFNQICQDFTGRTLEQLLGNGWIECVHPDDFPRCMDIYIASFDRREKFSIEYRLHRHDGEYRWFQSDGCPRYDSKGEFIGYIIHCLDITERKLVEQQLQEQQDHLEELVEKRTAELKVAHRKAEKLAQVKSEFLANMSHEIRTPLNAVLGLAQIGQRGIHPECKCAETFTRILNSGEQLLGIVNGILDFSKIEAGKLAIERVPIDLCRVIDMAVEIMAETARVKGLEFRVEKADNLPAGCISDELRLSQILVNLLSNAVKFTTQGHVTLAACQEGDSLVFRISDSGIGLTKKQVERLFTPFEQADSSTTRRYGGTGLGLAICKQLVDLMGGTISVESRIKHGSVFEVRLPLTEAKPPSRIESATAAGPQPKAVLGGRLVSLRILVAEDDVVNRLVLEEMLGYEGAQLAFVENGQQAVELIERNGADAWDIVLTDIQMPVMDGHEVARRIRELVPNLPIVGLTAHAMAEERDKCLASGMVAHITKPVDLYSLVATIQQHARQRSDSFTAASVEKPHDVARGHMPTSFCCIDWPALEEQFGGAAGMYAPEGTSCGRRSSFVDKLATTLLQSHAETPTLLRDAADQWDFGNLAALAHTIKGVAGNMMAQGVQKLAQDVETAARTAEPEVIDLTLKLAEALEGMLADAAKRIA